MFIKLRVQIENSKHLYITNIEMLRTSSTGAVLEVDALVRIFGYHQKDGSWVGFIGYCDSFGNYYQEQFLFEDFLDNEEVAQEISKKVAELYASRQIYAPLYCDKKGITDKLFVAVASDRAEVIRACYMEIHLLKGTEGYDELTQRFCRLLTNTKFSFWERLSTDTVTGIMRTLTEGASERLFDNDSDGSDFLAFINDSQI